MIVSINLAVGDSADPVPLVDPDHGDIKSRKRSSASAHVPHSASDRHNKVLFSICLLRRLESTPGGSRGKVSIKIVHEKFGCAPSLQPSTTSLEKRGKKQSLSVPAVSYRG